MDKIWVSSLEHTGLVVLVNCHSSSCLGFVLDRKRLFQLKQMTPKPCVCTLLHIMAAFDSHEYSEVWNSKYRFTIRTLQSPHKNELWFLSPELREVYKVSTLQRGHTSLFLSGSQEEGRAGNCFPLGKVPKQGTGSCTVLTEVGLGKENHRLTHTARR